MIHPSTASQSTKPEVSDQEKMDEPVIVMQNEFKQSRTDDSAESKFIDPTMVNMVAKKSYIALENDSNDLAVVKSHSPESKSSDAMTDIIRNEIPFQESETTSTEEVERYASQNFIVRASRMLVDNILESVFGMMGSIVPQSNEIKKTSADKSIEDHNKAIDHQQIDESTKVLVQKKVEQQVQKAERQGKRGLSATVDLHKTKKVEKLAQSKRKSKIEKTVSKLKEPSMPIKTNREKTIMTVTQSTDTGAKVRKDKFQITNTFKPISKFNKHEHLVKKQRQSTHPIDLPLVVSSYKKPLNTNDSKANDEIKQMMIVDKKVNISQVKRKPLVYDRNKCNALASSSLCIPYLEKSRREPNSKRFGSICYCYCSYTKGTDGVTYHSTCQCCG